MRDDEPANDEGEYCLRELIGGSMCRAASYPVRELTRTDSPSGTASAYAHPIILQTLPPFTEKKICRINQKTFNQRLLFFGQIKHRFIKRLFTSVDYKFGNVSVHFCGMKQNTNSLDPIILFSQCTIVKKKDKKCMHHQLTLHS